jgi:L-threonine kinase
MTIDPSSGTPSVPAGGKINRTIFQQYPYPIRRAYGAAVTERTLASRHGLLCKLGEAALSHMASMALSDYRNRRHADADPKVESVLGGIKRMSMGHFLQILRISSDAIQPALFDYKLTGTDESEALGRFFSAYSAIEDAIELEAQNLRRIVSQRIEKPAKVNLFSFWEKLVEYRNRAEAHPATYSWPIAHPDYYNIMVPLLEAALVQALTAPHIDRVFAEHPIATLSNIQYVGGTYLHEVYGEDLGLPFESTISLDRSVTDVWSHAAWKAEVGGHVMLEKMPSGAYEISGLMHDLVVDGPPSPLQAAVTNEPRVVVSGSTSTSPWRVGTGTAAGTCGELVQGFTSAGEPFHVTCPISKSATVTVTVRSAPEFSISQIDPKLSKLGQSLRATAALLELEPLEIRVEHWSDLDIGKGMGSSTADIVAGARALAAVAERPLSSADLGKIATSIESSDGSMYPGIVAFNQKNAHVLEEYVWWPQFVVCMITPPQIFNTESAVFTGKDKFGQEFDKILAKLHDATKTRSIQDFADAASSSAQLNQRFVPNPYYALIEDRINDFGAVGINVGHTGTVLGLLFDADDSKSMKSAASAAVELQRVLPASAKIDITLTPASPS